MHHRFFLLAAGTVLMGIFAFGYVLYPLIQVIGECATFQPAPKRTAGPSIPAVPGADPNQAGIALIPDEMIINDTRLQFNTELPPGNVFAFYQRQLESEGWSFVYRNTETDQLFMGNSLGCPFYGLDITAKPSGAGSNVLVGSYTNDQTCTCEY